MLIEEIAILVVIHERMAANSIFSIFTQGMNLTIVVSSERAIIRIRIIKQKRVLNVVTIAIPIVEGKKFTHNRFKLTSSIAVIKCVSENALPFPSASMIGE